MISNSTKSDFIDFSEHIPKKIDWDLGILSIDSQLRLLFVLMRAVTAEKGRARFHSA